MKYINFQYRYMVYSAVFSYDFILHLFEFYTAPFYPINKDTKIKHALEAGLYSRMDRDSFRTIRNISYFWIKDE